MDIIRLERKDVPNYLIKYYPFLDEETIVLKFKFELLNKVIEFDIEGEKMVQPGKINLIRIRPNGLNGFVTNHVKNCMEKNKHWNCSWIYITDTEIKMIDK